MAACHDWDHYDGQDEWIGEIIQAGAKIIPNVPP